MLFQRRRCPSEDISESKQRKCTSRIPGCSRRVLLTLLYVGCAMLCVQSSASMCHDGACLPKRCKKNILCEGGAPQVAFISGMKTQLFVSWIIRAPFSLLRGLWPKRYQQACAYTLPCLRDHEACCRSCVEWPRPQGIIWGLNIRFR